MDDTLVRHCWLMVQYMASKFYSACYIIAPSLIMAMLLLPDSNYFMIYSMLYVVLPLQLSPCCREFCATTNIRSTVVLFRTAAEYIITSCTTYIPADGLVVDTINPYLRST